MEGGLAIAIPLELRGLALAHARHGSLPWARLLEPVIPLARVGFPAHPYLVAALSANATLSRYAPRIIKVLYGCRRRICVQADLVCWANY